MCLWVPLDYILKINGKHNSCYAFACAWLCALSTDGTSVSLWWKCLSTPFIYTLFYIIYIIYTFGYFTHTVYTHSLPCVLFIICVLCVFYDSIHVLNVMFFSEPYLVLFIIMVSKQVYKVLWWSRIFQLKAYTRLCRMCAALQPSLWWVKNFLHQQSIRQFRYLRYGCPHPFSFINPCGYLCSLLGLALITQTLQHCHCFIIDPSYSCYCIPCFPYN